MLSTLIFVTLILPQFLWNHCFKISDRIGGPSTRLFFKTLIKREKLFELDTYTQHFAYCSVDS